MPAVSPADSHRHGPSKAELMERAQAGEAQAFRALVDEIVPLLGRFLRRRVADANELDDIIQETLIAVYQSRHTYEPSRPFEPWLFAIARNVAADYARRRFSRAAFEELVEDAPQSAAPAMEYAAARLRGALARLPEVQREAFMMLKVEGLSLSEAAQRVGISVGALKVRAHRAYQFLKKAFLG